MMIRVLLAAAVLLLPAASVHASKGEKSGHELFRLMQEEHQRKMKADPAYRHEALGDQHVEKQDFAKAAADYEQVVRLRPKNAHIHAKYARALLMIQKPREALAMADKSLALSSGKEGWLWWAWLHKGMAHAALGEMDAAIAALTRSIDMNASLPALVTRSGAYAERGRTEAALQDLDRALRISPKSAQLWIFKAQLHFRLMAEGAPDQMGEACAALRKACELGECRPLDDVKECKGQ
jgi:tetratricopeptide (TPR) repeat protein